MDSSKSDIFKTIVSHIYNMILKMKEDAFTGYKAEKGKVMEKITQAQKL